MAVGELLGGRQRHADRGTVLHDVQQPSDRTLPHDIDEATEGDLDRSLRQRELRGPEGLGDELRGVFNSDAATWGGISLLRESGPVFEPADTRFLASLSALLAEGLRRAALTTAVAAHPDEADEGLLVLGADRSVELSNAAAQQWLEELQPGYRGGDALPLVVHAVAGRARLAASGQATGDVNARARVATAAGRWVLVRGSSLGEGPDARTAVIVEPVPAPELAPLIAAAYGLTDRERVVVQLVAQGHSTNEISSRLFLSPYTVQDHLKAIFEKTGVRARGELVARIFFDHYATRMASDTPVAPGETPPIGPFVHLCHDRVS
jgi:DNA-binding CsgD family transcriptional regulator